MASGLLKDTLKHIRNHRLLQKSGLWELKLLPPTAATSITSGQVAIFSYL